MEFMTATPRRSAHEAATATMPSKAASVRETARMWKKRDEWEAQKQVNQAAAARVGAPAATTNNFRPSAFRVDGGSKRRCVNQPEDMRV